MIASVGTHIFTVLEIAGTIMPSAQYLAPRAKWFKITLADTGENREN